MRRHFIHHDACSYFIIPNIYSVDQADKNEELRALAINQLAGVLDDLNLIRSLSLSELKRLAKEETRGSFSDLAPLRRRHDNAKSRLHVQAASWKNWVGTMTGNTDLPEEENRLRNHGLLSKAQRVLDIAGWSTAAQRDFEVFRLVDCDGLTPLLALFNEATLAQGADAIESVRKDQEALEDQRRLQIAHQRNA